MASRSIRKTLLQLFGLAILGIGAACGTFGGSAPQTQDAVPSIWPVRASGRIISSGFGDSRGHAGGRARFHTGVDIRAPQGSEVVAAAAGYVIETGSDRGGYGRFVKIGHGKGYETWYAHLAQIGVRKGDRVARGQVIGKVGKTGNVTGFHLHYEVRKNGVPVDPMPYLP